MKKTMMLAALAGLMLAQQAMAFTVTVTRIPGYYKGNGGEFNVKSSDSYFNNQIVPNYASVAKVNGGLETFCLDRNIGLQSSPLSATIVPTGVAAGVGWLYSQFAQGVLQNYVYSPIGTGSAQRGASAWGLQNAIWALQGQTPFDPVAGAYYYNLALAQFGNSASAAMDQTDPSPYDVSKLAMRGARNERVSQPMLVWHVPGVPDGGVTIMLLGVALTGLGLIRRKIGA